MSEEKAAKLDQIAEEYLTEARVSLANGESKFANSLSVLAKHYKQKAAEVRALDAVSSGDK